MINLFDKLFVFIGKWILHIMGIVIFCLLILLIETYLLKTSSGYPNTLNLSNSSNNSFNNIYSNLNPNGGISLSSSNNNEYKSCCDIAVILFSKTKMIYLFLFFVGCVFIIALDHMIIITHNINKD